MEHKDFTNYIIYDNGDVYSKKSKKFLKPSKDKKGYMTLSLFKNENKYSKKVHRLVAECYIPNPDNLNMVNHKDCDRTNNNLSNLEWCSNLYNSQSINTTRNFGCISNRKGGNRKTFQARFRSNGVNYTKEFKNREDAETWLFINKMILSQTID